MGKSKGKSQYNKKDVARCKDFDFSGLNSKYTDSEFKNKFRECWRNEGSPIEEASNGLDVMKKPFNCAFLPQMLSDSNLVDEVRNQIIKLPFQTFNNDMYKFKSAAALDGESNSCLEKFCSLLCGPVKAWVEEVSGIELDHRVSINSSIYKYSDTLLCHDDKLENRRVAFILYLSPLWKPEFGGTLDLFSLDKLGRPKTIEKRIVPQYNGFSFFEVSPASYHQVSEVVSKNESRISINGWFHGPPLKFPNRYCVKSPVYYTPGHIEEHLVYSWLNPLYLEQTTQADVKKEFQDRSEIQLAEFLKAKKYQQLSEALRKHNIQWKFVGPPYKRHYETMKRQHFPEIVVEFLQLMRSEALFLIFSQLTGLRLHPLAPPNEENKNSDNESSSEDENLSDTPQQSPANGGRYNDPTSYSSSEDEATAAVDSSSGKRSKAQRKKEAKKRRKRMEKNEGEAKENQLTSTLNNEWVSDVEESSNQQDSSNDNAIGEMMSEVRRWRWGSYSLMRDDDLMSAADFTLDAAFFCNGSDQWGNRLGGSTIYVANGETEQLLTIVPKPNTLALVYRDSETLKFTKYINVKSTNLDLNESSFQEILCQYRENK